MNWKISMKKANKWLSLWKEKKDSKVQNLISQTIANNNTESYSTKSKIKQNASIQSKEFEQAIKIMGHTFEGRDIEIEM